MYYDNAQLRELLLRGESHLVEFKRSLGDRRAIRRNICAFANDGPGTSQTGVLFVGVEDDGSCAQTTIDDSLLKTLALMRSDGSIQPLPSMRVEETTIDGCRMAVVQVEPSRNPPVRCEGRAWVKVGPTVQQATMDDERQMMERRRAADVPFDRRPHSSATVAALDEEYIESVYLSAAVAEDVLKENQRLLHHQMESLRLLQDGTPTWGALLAMAHDPLKWVPSAYVQYVRFDGIELSSPVKDHEQITGQLGAALRRLDEVVRGIAKMSVDIVPTGRDVRRYDYPPAALVQLARNAVMHRNYESNAPVRLYQFDDRIYIESPGGLYGQVTRGNMEKGVTDYRNPLIAEIMHHLGFAQKFGVGIPLAMTALRDNGNPPVEFEVCQARVVATVRPAPER